MEQEHANSEVARIIRSLALKPHETKSTERATYDMLSLGITKDDVCDAIRQWIDDRNDIEAKITAEVAEHQGRTHYILKPAIKGESLYVKLDILENPYEHLVIVSCHK